jgi:hypothetical protein
MVLKFEIVKLFDHHNRGQFIAARQLNFKQPAKITEGSLLNGVPVYHYLEMYPILQEEEPQVDIYFFRPMELGGYPKGTFKEGQIVELILSDS